MLNAQEALKRFEPSLRYIDFLKEHIDVVFIAIADKDERLRDNNVEYYFFKGREGVLYYPLRLLRYLKEQQPDVVLVQGMGYPMQVIYLRMLLGSKVCIILQHHGDQPLKGVRKILQKIADKYINAYLFTSKGNAQLWIDEGMISAQDKCYEVLEASSLFVQQNREDCRAKYNIKGSSNFLWVGRLNENKDPLTVVRGFEKYLAVNTEARLYMIFQTTELLGEIKLVIENSAALKAAVFIVGEVGHDELAYWYSAVDFYISGSHREGSGYALIEAMACGCVPVVTDIPPFRAITGGSLGFLYEKGESDALLQALIKTGDINWDKESKAVVHHFDEKLSFKRIADDILQVCKKLVR